MKLRSPSAQELQLATLAAQTLCPGLTPETLVAALRQYEPGSADTNGPDEWLSVPEAARLGKWHPRTVARWAREGRFPAGRVGARWRIQRSDLDDFMRRRGAA